LFYRFHLIHLICILYNKFELFSNGKRSKQKYDFSGAVRGVTASRYAQGANVVIIDPEVLDVFPDSLAVNEALRALAPLLRRKRESKAHR
jgi:hypothetical protein